MTDSRTDLVCGMAVNPALGLSADHAGTAYLFCSEFCRSTFLANPERFLALPPPPDPEEDPAGRRIAYFSMEVGVDERLPIYSGGLGVLAGDTLRSFADLRFPAVGVSLLYEKGYFRQILDAAGNQTDQPVEWRPSDFVRELPTRVAVAIEGRAVAVRAWRYDVKGLTGHVVPLLLLDTNLEENRPEDREITARLYGGDDRYRLRQEIVLGIGGVRMLRALNYRSIQRHHMNEGHASLLALELLREESDQTAVARDIHDVRRMCVFTTHTPVPAGHDQFDWGLVREVLGEPIPLAELQMLGGQDRLNMTRLALNLSGYVNGVAKKHGEVSQRMFPGYAVDSITNGVHTATWVCPSVRVLFDRYIPGWASDPFSLRHAIKIPIEDLREAHLEAKWRLVREVRQRLGVELSSNAFTIGFARRATAYKRADLLLQDPERLAAISRAAGRIQIVYAGKAHPKDEPGKELIRRIHAAAERLRRDVTIVYLPDYAMEVARFLTAGVDVWLNTPLRPQEASGTSGMKAAVNGVPSLSILDGWWIEGHVEGITGWSIGEDESDETADPAAVSARDASELYAKLEQVLLPLHAEDPAGWMEVGRRAIAFNGSFFHTHRMVQQYAANAYI
jgi:starch phosphorylase